MHMLMLVRLLVQRGRRIIATLRFSLELSLPAWVVAWLRFW
jgi:hypothetical protein